MTDSKLKPAGFGNTPLLAILGLLMGTSVGGQTKEQSPADLIKFLTYQSDRPDKYGIAKGMFSCGTARAESEENRAAVDALVKLGVSAIPDIEAAFDSIEKHGGESAFAFNSQWLLEAYARIKGPAAYPRLRRMWSIPKFAFLQWGIDQSVALSLGLTSYVSGSRVLASAVICTGVSEPRYLLDRLILAWEKNDRHWLEASLGPRAKASLTSLLKRETWAGVRGELWHGKSGESLALGYRFEASGWWSEREQPVEIRLDDRKPVNPELDTVFTNSSGGDCGRLRVRFLLTKGEHWEYLIDNSDLVDLLRVISSCAHE